MKIIFVFGTRPEAIKLAPVIHAFKRDRRYQVYICVTGQHRHLLDQVLDIFKLVPDFDLSIMEENQNLFDITSKVLSGLRKVFLESRPDLLFVHGDTSTTMAASLAALYLRIPTAHIEAGLRTWNNSSPWPEEANRKIVSQLADFHFAPTWHAKNNLLKSGIESENIFIVGNTAIDAAKIGSSKLIEMAELHRELSDKYDFLCPDKKLVLITCHRRENFSSGILDICSAIKKLANRPDIQLIWPVHPNPNIHRCVFQELENIENIYLTPPLEYLEFIFLMKRAYLILTDSGGIQEEAPYFKRPVLVLRETTERPEAVQAGTVKVIGSGIQGIIKNVELLLDDRIEYEKFTSATNPYGSGNTSQEILRVISEKYVL